MSFTQRRPPSGVAQVALVIAFGLLLIWMAQSANPSMHPHVKPTETNHHKSTPHTKEKPHSHPKNPMLEMAPTFIDAIMDPENSGLTSLQCPPVLEDGPYGYLREWWTAHDPAPVRKWFFALNLHQCAEVLPRLLGSVIEAIKFLGPHSCVLSVVEGRSTDGTKEVLHELRKSVEDLGAAYFLSTKDINPDTHKGGRLEGFAELRNLALKPIINSLDHFENTTSVIFLNDVAACPDDILELIHQQRHQEADMVCGMDWQVPQDAALFRDIWDARTMQGDTFFNISEGGHWEASTMELFSHDKSLQKADRDGKPFQVFSCWNGAAVFNAKPLIDHEIAFRGPRPGECPQPEPKSFCKDLWNLGYNRIAVVPAVNLGYGEGAGRMVKKLRGPLADWVKKGSTDDRIEWQDSPPEKVKCMPSFSEQYWEDWNSTVGE